MTHFDGNDYRKRVLAPIEARGGVPASDPFEWYDVPLEEAESLKDRMVAEKIGEVWAFWQKQRDHPKYRGLVTALLDVHDQVAPQLIDKARRMQLAGMARAHRVERDADRFAELDAAIDRLVERFGGIPLSKLDGLRAFAVQAGIDAASAEHRLSRYPHVEDGPVPTRGGATAVPASVYRQVRADLDELGRILGGAGPVSLYDLLGLPPGAPTHQVARERDVAAARNRELRPDRRRALVDDLLAAVANLLLDGDPDAYLDTLAEEVTARLRPRVAAAVLVEDELTSVDHGHLVGEAEAAGLDPERARRVLSDLARDFGVVVPRSQPSQPRPAHDPVGPRQLSGARTGPASTTAWHDTLSEARAALRAGQARRAEQLVERARREAAGTMPPIRAVADEVQEVLAEAEQRWKVAVQALRTRRFSEAAGALERLRKIAADVSGPDGRSAQEAWDEAQRGEDAAKAALARANSLDGDARELALVDAWHGAPDQPDVLAALQAVGVQPPRDVRAVRLGSGVVVRWVPSGTPGPVDYRVVRIDDSGRQAALGTTSGTELDTIAPPGDGPLPTYVVIARRAGISSPEASTGGPRAPTPVQPPRQAPPKELPPTIATLVVASHGRRVRLVYPQPLAGRAEVRRWPDGVPLPVPGTVVDPAACGPVVPGMGPGLAVDAKPPSPTAYVALTVDAVAVAGASAWYVDLPAVSGLHVRDRRLRFDWPSGCTEVLVAWRKDAPPEHADDPAAERRKLTNTRYELDGGLPLPGEGPLHVAVFACRRKDGNLLTATEAPAAARLALGDVG